MSITPEQLDAIEKEARAGGPEDDGAGDIAAFLVDCRILPLVKALREARDYVADARSEAISVRATLGYQLEEARAEVERLREAVRQVHALAEKGRADWPRHTAWGALVDIHTITNGMVK